MRRRLDTYGRRGRREVMVELGACAVAWGCNNRPSAPRTQRRRDEAARSGVPPSRGGGELLGTPAPAWDGMYHPKPRGTRRSVEHVTEVASDYRFRFPVGLDTDWSVLDAYWLSLGGRRYTSVAFVLDKLGIIRFVHPGPEFHPDGPEDHVQCRRDFADISRALDVLSA